ncbi:MAG: hypothetical protein ABW321_24865 [Polyangiales bacterium]
MTKGLVSAAAVAGLTLAASAASAVVISDEDGSHAARVTGFVTVHDDTTKWSLRVTDTRGEGYGAYAKIVIDRDEHSDNEIRSDKTDHEGDTITFTGDKHYSRTRGAKVYVCVDRQHDSDTCTRIEHVKEDE